MKDKKKKESVMGGGNFKLNVVLDIHYNDLVGLLGAAMMSGMTVTYAYIVYNLIAATVGVSIPALGLLGSAYDHKHMLVKVAYSPIDAAGYEKERHNDSSQYFLGYTKWHILFFCPIVSRIHTKHRLV